MIQKIKRIRLKGKEKSILREMIFERDNYHCVICGDVATDWHHQPFGASKSDEYYKGVALCHDCHIKLHSDAKLCTIFQKIVKDYLRGIYDG